MIAESPDFSRGEFVNTISNSEIFALNPYAAITAASFDLCASRKSFGIVNSSYRSASVEGQ